jgi:hypothetical protein
MTKADLPMTNHELQARVIELENELRSTRLELDHTRDELGDQETRRKGEIDDAYAAKETAEGKLDALEAQFKEMVETRPAEAFADWYKRLHPRGPGSDPDLEVVRQSQYAKILA